MAFVEFKSKKSSFREPTVTIKANGQIYVNRGCMDKYFKGCEHVTFLYDEENKLVAIRPVDEGVSHSYTLRLNRGMGLTSGMSFMKTFDILKSGSRRYAATWSDQVKAVVLDLKRPLKILEGKSQDSVSD